VGVQRIGGDHRAGQLQAGQQWGERGDLAGGAVDLALGEHRAGGMVHRGEQMDLPTVWSGAPQHLAVDRDRPSPLAGTVAAGQPRADHRPGAGQDRGGGDRKDRHQRIPAAAVPSRVVDGGEVGEQLRRAGRS
jgi:hypothetical protein